jgi:hypothetical protein
MTLDEKIALAQRHVESGRRIIERQRVIVARHGKRSATDLLESFQQTQQIFEMDLADLLKRSEAGSGWRQRGNENGYLQIIAKLSDGT